VFPRRRLLLKIVSVALVVIAAWVAFDLFSPRTAHLREFDPDEVSRLEMPGERFMDHGRLRAEAMTKAEQGGVTEAAWARIDELLHQSWRSLPEVMNGRR